MKKPVIKRSNPSLLRSTSLEKGRKAFTLVELIVVITILAILWTIAFISLQWYSRDARDGKRTSDVWNMKTTLELFNINAWKYPSPDSPLTISYSWDTVWYQWTIWDIVTTNLKWLDKKPVDPLTKAEYTYSTTQSYKEYQILALYEWNLAYNPVINTANAATSTLTPKVVWNYNELFVQTNNYIVPTPSIITSEPWNVVLDWTTIKSQVTTNWTNIPKTSVTNTQTGWLDAKFIIYTWSINNNSTNLQKINAIVTIQKAYNWTSLAKNSTYKNILNTKSTKKTIDLSNTLILKTQEKQKISLKTVADCWTWIWPNPWDIIYWTVDWTDNLLMCWDDIILCKWTWTWIVLQACNAWAVSSFAWTGTDTYGKYYQWWNNWWTLSWDIVTSSTTLVDATGYWPGNYYNNPTFILWAGNPPDWQLWTINNNLWWDVTNTNEARRWPCNIWYHVPTWDEWVEVLTVWPWDYNSDYNLMVNALKMPKAWSRRTANSIPWQWISWAYWSSSDYFSNSYHYSHFMLLVGRPSASLDPWNEWTRRGGLSVRCFKN